MPDIGGEVARSLGHFFDQRGNQQVLAALFKRGVRISDTHPPSAKLRADLNLQTLLQDLEIPKLTELRARQLAAGPASMPNASPPPDRASWRKPGCRRRPPRRWPRG